MFYLAGLFSGLSYHWTRIRAIRIKHEQIHAEEQKAHNRAIAQLLQEMHKDKPRVPRKTGQ
jgi:hypothetical protein